VVQSAVFEAVPDSPALRCTSAELGTQRAGMADRIAVLVLPKDAGMGGKLLRSDRVEVLERQCGPSQKDLGAPCKRDDDCKQWQVLGRVPDWVKGLAGCNRSRKAQRAC
jgi:hypothetical protein